MTASAHPLSHPGYGQLDIRQPQVEDMDRVAIASQCVEAPCQRLARESGFERKAPALLCQRIESLERDSTGLNRDILRPEGRQPLRERVGVHELVDCKSALEQSGRSRALPGAVGPTEYDYGRRNGGPCVTQP